MKKLILITLLVGGALSFTSCGKDEKCKCTGAAPIGEDDCDCNVHELCDDRKQLGMECNVE